MIHGWYYLHTNKQLIYKNSPDAIDDIRESDFCESVWAWDYERHTAWGILVEALSLGADKDRIKELADKWGCTDIDADNYAAYLGIDIGMDGAAHYARKRDFGNAQENPIGFGETYLEAMANLAKELGYTGGKMWNHTFKTLTA
jgi:hypothetical protein